MKLKKYAKAKHQQIKQWVLQIVMCSLSTTKWYLNNPQYSIKIKDIKTLDIEKSKGKRLIISIKHSRWVIYLHYT